VQLRHCVLKTPLQVSHVEWQGMQVDPDTNQPVAVSHGPHELSAGWKRSTGWHVVHELAVISVQVAHEGSHRFHSEPDT